MITSLLGRRETLLYLVEHANTFGLIASALVGQVLTGWHDNNDALQQMCIATLTLPQYLGSGHLLETTFENWESGFLQMGVYVVLTIGLRQQVSPQSKPVDASTAETGK